MISALVAFAVITDSVTSQNRIDFAESELVAAKQNYLDAIKNKSDLESAAFKYAEVVMTSPVLAPMEKYPLALALYRQTLAINPDHKQAKDQSQLIVDIYAGLGKEPTEFDLSKIK